MAGKTGADALYLAMAKVNRVLAHYGAKFVAFAVIAQGGGVITSAELVVIQAWVNQCQEIAIILEKLAGNNSILP